MRFVPRIPNYSIMRVFAPPTKATSSRVFHDGSCDLHNGMTGCVNRLTAFCWIYGLGVMSQAIRVYIFERLARLLIRLALYPPRRRCEVGDIRISRQVVGFEQRDNAIMRRSFRLVSVIKYRDCDIVTISSVSVSAFSWVLLRENACAAGNLGTKTSDLLAERRQRRIASNWWVSTFFYYFFLLRWDDGFMNINWLDVNSWMKN